MKDVCVLGCGRPAAVFGAIDATGGMVTRLCAEDWQEFVESAHYDRENLADALTAWVAAMRRHPMFRGPGAA